MTTLYLIRHGQASIGTSNYDVLSALGERQSSILGAYLEKTNVRFDHIFSGTLQRQIDTARISLGLKPDAFTRNAAFNEYQHNKIFNHYATQLAQDDPEVAAILTDGDNSPLTYGVFASLMNAWVTDNQPHGELESWGQFKSRITEGLRSVIDNSNNADRIAIYTSGGVICTIVKMITQCPEDRIFELNWGIFNAGITTLKTTDATLKLSTYNSIAHLELENDSSLITNI